ncbi:hypothetical protein AeRB84_003786 [Aphanomyces euteiches]|nr:hypothetical protein AeRB84_003786 [Aphanomyces euteiches]
MVIRDYITPIIPNEPLQHGFQKDRTRTNSDLFLTSKDCLKCFDRVPSWVTEYVYLKLGVPPTPRKLMAHSLGASQIDIRTAFGWVDGGHRDFGLGQGFILAVMHIGYYMDILQQQQQRGLDPVQLVHHQHIEGPTQRSIGSLLFVDDALDVATSYAGIQHRATTSNIFTGKYASGGVFGAEKSFMLYLSSTHHPATSLNNGLGEPQPVKILAPIEGFKHLGIHQGAGAQWAANTQALWRKLKRQAEQIAPKRLTGAELRYIVNAVWLPSILYRCALSDSLSIVSAFDVLIRKTTKRVLQLPHDHPTEWFYDTMDGLGLQNCEHLSRSQRLYHVLRIANDAGSPAYDALMDAMETYQLQMGLTDYPLATPVPPPTSDQSFLGTAIRIAAANTHNYTIHATWQSPPQCISTRPCDQSIWHHLSPQLSTKLLQINKVARLKVRWLGDITNERGTQLLSLETLRLRFGWAAQHLAFEHIWSAIPLAPQPPRYALRQSTLPWANDRPPKADRPSATIRQRLNPLPLLLNPLGRARSVQTQGIHTIHIPLGALLIIPILLTRPGQPDVLSYQIGRRDSIQTRIVPTGTEIAVTNWYEQRKGSGIWYAPSKRELRRSTRLTP